MQAYLVNANADCDSCAKIETVYSPVRPLLIPRNQGANTARELVGFQDFMHLGPQPDSYGVFGVALEYVRSFEPEKIARQLFGRGEQRSGCDCSCPDSQDLFFLRFQGSKAADRKEWSLLADNFGLSQDYDGSLKIKPRIDNFIVDFQVYLDFENWAPGLWCRINAPVTNTRWDLFDNEFECVNGSNSVEEINEGSKNTNFPVCYMAETEATPTPNILTALDGEFLFGDMQTEWKFGKFSSERLHQTRIADIDFIFGYDFLSCHNSHFGLFIQASAPTGNAPDAEYIFEPIVGNGHHWGLGGGLTAHVTFFENDCDQSMELWIEGNVQHLFWDRQRRSFDFKQQGPLSRYMLLKEFDEDGQYSGRLINGINFATRNVETQMKIMGDASIKLAYRNNHFSADIGYNIWGRAAEEVRPCCIKDCLSLSDVADNTFGFKGCEGVCALNYTANGENPNLITTQANPAQQMLVNTSSDATAFNCGTVDNGANINGPVAGENTATLAWDSNQTLDTAVVGPTDMQVEAFNSNNQDNPVIFAQNSNSLKLLTQDDLNFVGARSSMTHKVFGYIGSSWHESDFAPFIGIYGEVEFDAKRIAYEDCCVEVSEADVQQMKTFRDSAINQWGLGIKGGCAF